MTTPSFTSFPAFGSFPDIDPAADAGPSTARPAENANAKGDKHKSRKRPKAKAKTRRLEESADTPDENARTDDARRKDAARDTRRGADERAGVSKSKSERDGHRHGHRRDRDRDWTRDRDRKPDRDADRAPAHAHPRESVHYDDAGALDARPLFISDRKGDPLNVSYGKPHAGDVPKYRLIAGGRKVLGLGAAWTVVYRSNRGVEIAIGGSGQGGRRKIPSLTDSAARKLLNAPPTRPLVVPTAGAYKYAEVDGFLRLPSRRGGGSAQPYRSITQADRARASDSDSSSSSSRGRSRSAPSDNDASSGSESDGDGDADAGVGAGPRTAHQQTLAALERRLAAVPTALPAWRALLAHMTRAVPDASRNAARARAEVTLAVLERALRAHPNNRRAPALRLAYLRAGEEVWSKERVEREWEEAVREAGGLKVWVEWFDWRVRKAEGGMDALVDDARRAMESVKGDEMGMLRIFWRTGVAFQQAGYVERATALFQAYAELTFALPPHLHGAPLSVQLDALEEFWEAEVPRAGEDGGNGWAAWVASGRPDATASPTASIPVPTPSTATGDPYQRWAAAEAHADAARYVPLRGPAADGAADDPYATILFADVRPLLDALSPAARDAFRRVWLAVLGMYVPGLAASLSCSDSIQVLASQGTGDDKHADADDEADADERWASTHLARPSYLDAVFPAGEAAARRVAADAHAGVLVGREREFGGSGLGGPVKAWGASVLEPLEGVPGEDADAPDGKEHGKGRKAWVWRAEDVRGLDVEFVRRVFAFCRLGEEDTQWDTLTLAFEAAVGMKRALKLSRTFLATARSSLPHWAAHARLERLRGRTDDARKVYQTVLTAQAGPDADTSADAGTAQLWWDWAELEWLARRPDDALAVILRAAGVQAPAAGGVAVLRGKRALEARIAHGAGAAREAWVKLRALVEVLAGVGPSAQDALLGVLDAALAPLRVGSTAHERLCVAGLLMLFHHGRTLRRTAPPGPLRERAAAALALYPGNTVVLGVVLEAERGQGVWGRVRALLGESGGGVDRDGTPVEKSVGRRVAEVWIAGWERGRWEGEKERVRSGLAAAVQSERTKGSAVLWRMYLEFEIRAGELARAKKLLFRAVGECPLSKELYLLAFGPLRSAFTGRELGGWVDTMAERGIRMRAGLDEVLEGDGREASEAGDDAGSDDDDYGEADVERNAEELRRLRPY